MSNSASDRRRAAARDRAPGNHWPRRAQIIAAAAGTVLAGSVAFAASNWVVGLNAGSSGQPRSVTISSLTITATSSAAPTSLLYPGATGDVVITVANSNPFPVTITAFDLPSNASYATGYSNRSLTTPQAGCSAAAPSGVTWSFAAGTTSTHVLTSAVTVAANGSADNPLTITLTGAASMSTSARAPAPAATSRCPPSPVSRQPAAPPRPRRVRPPGPGPPDRTQRGSDLAGQPGVDEVARDRQVRRNPA